MALKFLNKKGWHTGSLRNIENVWKAEQKHADEQKKLEELRQQIREERERAEFRQLQEQAGLVPKQERVDFLYDSGLAVGKGGSSFKSLEPSLPKNEPEASASSSAAAKEQSVTPGALFEDKPQSANDAWRKLHSDPLLLIRQREQEALARVKNNPVQMAMIRKSVEAKKDKNKDEKKQKTKHKRKKSKHHKYSSSENDADSEDATLKVDKRRESHHKGSKSERSPRKVTRYSDEDSSEGDDRRRKYYDKEYRHWKHREASNPRYDRSDGQQGSEKNRSENNKFPSERQQESHHDKDYRHWRPSEASNPRYDRSEGQQRSEKSHSENNKYPSERQQESRHDTRGHSYSSDNPSRNEPNNRHRKPVQLSEEERAAKLREMQMDAECHEEQRWKRLKKAADSEAKEAMHDNASLGRNFLDAAQKSMYGAEKGGSSTIEESVRRRTHYLQGRSDTDSNAFRR